MKTCIVGGTLHSGTRMPGLWAARETPNNNLDTAVPRANLHHSIITALDSSRQVRCRSQLRGVQYTLQYIHGGAASH